MTQRNHQSLIYYALPSEDWSSTRVRPSSQGIDRCFQPRLKATGWLQRRFSEFLFLEGNNSNKEMGECVGAGRLSGCR